MPNVDKDKNELLDVLKIASRDEELLESFLRDLLTPSEFLEIITRWQIIKRLSLGENQRVIAGDLKIGIGTVTRGSRALLNSSGGFNKILEKLGYKSEE
jgi:TrpR family trp operon transcriptional repressor